ncbi:hypothetical protein AALO_G00271100 [Alosa alosa]|uniref:Uncharacterized protein n=1 Tax=Alosa alosa TaxID=278164 RepID=A0AAV6FSC0_9TELE|nr:hypothetical protein AALO_G00271100 [Alosa alosa]
MQGHYWMPRERERERKSDYLHKTEEEAWPRSVCISDPGCGRPGAGTTPSSAGTRSHATAQACPAPHPPPVYTHTHTHTHAHTHACAHTHTRTHAHTHTRMHAHTHTRTHGHTGTQAHTHAYTGTRAHTHTMLLYINMIHKHKHAQCPTYSTCTKTQIDEQNVPRQTHYVHTHLAVLQVLHISGVVSISLTAPQDVEAVASHCVHEGSPIRKQVHL